MKKVISVITALLVLAICLCPTLAFAAGKPTFEISSAKAARDEGAEITITVKNSPGITSAKLLVSFDESLTLKNVEFGEKLTGNTLHSEKLHSPLTLNWFSGVDDVKGDFVFATLTFAAGSKTKAGDYKISATYDKNDVFNLKEKSIDFKVAGGVLTVTGDPGEVITGSDAATATDDADGETKVTGDYEDDAEYTGEELTFDEEGNPVETTGTEDSEDSTGKYIWIGVGAAVVIALAVVIVIATRKGKNEPETGEPEKTEEPEEQ